MNLQQIRELQAQHVRNVYQSRLELGMSPNLAIQAALQVLNASGSVMTEAELRAIVAPERVIEAQDEMNDGEIITAMPAAAPTKAEHYRETVPEEMRRERRWLVYRLVWSAAKGKNDKVPFNPLTGEKANNPELGVLFEEALQHVDDYDGLGFYVEPPYLCIDIDSCRNAETGEIEPNAADVIRQVDSYTEASPSGTGVHIWVKGVKPGEKCRKGAMEIYSTGRFMTVTGVQFAGTPQHVHERDITSAYKRMVAGEFVKEEKPKTKTSVSVTETGGLVIQDTSDQSDSGREFHLILDLIKEFPNADADELNDIFRERHADKYRPKWDDGRDYILYSIERALSKAEPSANVLLPVPSVNDGAWSVYGLTKEEYNSEMDKDYPVLKFAEEQPGPAWEDDVMYGVAGEIVRKASEYCEAHPAGMYLDFLIAMGSIFGHQPRCRIHPATHYTNEFGLRVGLTSTGRKGTGDNAINEVIKHVDSNWYQHRRISRFGSAEAIINEVRDPFVQQIRVGGRKGDGPRFKEITVPGVDDKRLFIRVGEFSAVLDLVNKRDSGAASVMRLGWDGDPLDDVVKGKSNDGISNSVRCAEPHISIFADTTKSELISKMPAGADENGFGNRFLYCYAYRTKLCPNGGPELDWGQEITRLIQAVEFAKDIKHVPMTKVAHKVWGHMYEEMERTRPGGMLGLMVSRGPAHVRRLAMVLALLDLNDAVETKHLHAAKRLWDYCQESAQYIFVGYTKDQLLILKWVESKQAVTVTEIARDLFHWNRKAAWVRTQVNDLAKQSYLTVVGEQVKPKKQRAA